MSKATFENLLFASLLLGALALIVGCESRSFTAQRPDGTIIKYSRISLIGDSSSEGVSVSKDGDDLNVEVGPTGSQVRIDQAIELLKAIP